MRRSIDLNADLGEDESPQGIKRELALMKLISSCNIACGGHAGSPASMERMLNAAKASNVMAGAHPSYPDRKNFGRQSMEISHSQLRSSLQDQINLLMKISTRCGASLKHLKPHGALYNDAQNIGTLAELLVKLAGRSRLAIVGMSGSFVDNMARKHRVKFIAEAFVDRRYDDESRLVSRNEERALIVDKSKRVEQGLAIARGEYISSIEGKNIRITADSLCLHADSKGAVSSAEAIRKALENSGFPIEALLS